MNEQEQDTTQALQVYGDIFAQLLDSPRFIEFFELYYTVQKLVDEEAKTITYMVVENPPEEIAKRVRSKVQEQTPLIEVAKGIPESALKKVRS